MMKKKFIYSLPVLAALAFSGCGSSSTEAIKDAVESVITTESEKLISSGYSVVVERGAVLDANVTDANGSVAVQVSDTNNTYIFESEPIFPIVAEGGWIDVDGDGNLTEEDVALDINLTSYSDVITPTTTYIADENETIRNERLEELSSEANCTKEELLTVPSKAIKNSIMVLNAVYEKLIERGNTNSKAPIAIRAILDRYTEINNNTNLDENATSEEMALAIEKETITKLQSVGLIKKLNADEIKNIKAKRPKKIKDKDKDKDKDDDDKDDDSTETDDDSTDDSQIAVGEVNGDTSEKVDDDKVTSSDKKLEKLEDDDKVTGSDKKPEKVENDDKVTGSDKKPEKVEDDDADKLTGNDKIITIVNDNKPEKVDNPNKKANQLR